MVFFKFSLYSNPCRPSNSLHRTGSPLTILRRGRILFASSNNKPVTQTSKQNEVLSESCRWWDGSRSSFAEWTAEGGLNADGQVGTDGLFPRYQGRACDGTPPSGRIPSNWVAPQKFRLLSQENTFYGSLRGWRSFFDAPHAESTQIRKEQPL